jgi:DNA-binding beta-propeller fold protein YncE
MRAGHGSARIDRRQADMTHGVTSRRKEEMRQNGKTLTTGARWRAPIGARMSALVVLISLCILGGGLAISSAALAARGHVFEKSFGTPCASGPCPGGALKEPSGVAVDEAAGGVYVADKGNDRVERFSAAGAYLGQFDGSGSFEVEGKVESGAAAPTGRLEGPDGVAVDNSTSSEDPSAGDLYVVDSGHGVIDKFTAEGAYLGQIEGTGTTTFAEQEVVPEGVSVDLAGQVWVYTESVVDAARTVDSYTNAASNEFVASRETFIFASFASRQFAVDAEDNLYVGHEGEIAKFSNTGELEQLKVGEELATAVSVELSTGQPYLDDGQQVTRFSAGPSTEVVERFGAGILSKGEGLAVDGSTGRAFVADAGTDLVDVFPLAKPGRPGVHGEGASEITGESAALAAEVDPQGAASEYRFEYGPCATAAACPASAYTQRAPVPDGALPSGFGSEAVGARIQSLQAGTVYHYRVVARNEFGPTEGSDHTFTTQAAGGFALPDGRRWEMVSPRLKRGASIEPIGGEWLIQAAAAGNAIAYTTDAPTEAGAQGNANLVPDLSTLGTEGWITQDLAIPHEHETAIPIGHADEYLFFSEDLSAGIVQPFGSFTESLSPSEASEQTAFRRSDFASGNVAAACEAGCYRPLVTGAPGYANVPPATAFGEEGSCPAHQGICGPRFEGATPDASHVVLGSEVALTPTSLPAGGKGLYIWSAGKPPSEQLELISTLPPPSSQPVGHATLGYQNNARHAIATDGSRMVWTSGEGHLYLHDSRLHETVQLDEARGGNGQGAADPRFQIAAEDDGRVYFTDPQQLTENAGTGEGRDLYECAIHVTVGKLQCNLTDLTPAPGPGRAAEVQGSVIGASEDGGWLYFVANGVLGDGAEHGAEPGNCTVDGRTVDGACNLYVYNGGATHFIATVPGKDYLGWLGANGSSLNELVARVSPDGRWLTFMSSRSLTAYDNTDAVSGKPDEEAFLYHAESSAAGTLVCASCDPTGARPVGAEYASLDRTLVGGDRVWPETTWIAANIPGWTPYALGVSIHQSRYLSNAGRLFFNSSDPLVSKDSNGPQEDVYEYEPQGVGDCTSSTANGSVVFSAAAGGCVGLISSGSSGEQSAFLDASESGSDVFFLTSARLLLQQDVDRSFDIYDAHECTTASPCLAAPAEGPPACVTADSCRAAPSSAPEVFGAPASAIFSGVGNLAPASPGAGRPRAKARGLAGALRVCHRMRRKRRRRCEHRARARHASKHATQPITSRSGGTRKGAAR